MLRFVLTSAKYAKFVLSSSVWIIFFLYKKSQLIFLSRKGKSGRSQVQKKE